MNDNSLVTLEIIYRLEFPNNLPKWKTQILWVSTESNMTAMFIKRISYWKSLNIRQQSLEIPKLGRPEALNPKSNTGSEALGGHPQPHPSSDWCCQYTVTHDETPLLSEWAQIWPTVEFPVSFLLYDGIQNRADIKSSSSYKETPSG